VLELIGILGDFSYQRLRHQQTSRPLIQRAEYGRAVLMPGSRERRGARCPPLVGECLQLGWDGIRIASRNAPSRSLARQPRRK
jgi:hypothetical protein